MFGASCTHTATPVAKGSSGTSGPIPTTQPTPWTRIGSFAFEGSKVTLEGQSSNKTACLRITEGAGESVSCWGRSGGGTGLGSDNLAGIYTVMGFAPYGTKTASIVARGGRHVAAAKVFAWSGNSGHPVYVAMFADPLFGATPHPKPRFDVVMYGSEGKVLARSQLP
jgi:hypothetical protein